MAKKHLNDLFENDGQLYMGGWRWGYRCTGCSRVMESAIDQDETAEGAVAIGARSFASALPAHLWTAVWIYLTAPPIGMLPSAEMYVRAKSLKQVYCAKLHSRTTSAASFAATIRS